LLLAAWHIGADLIQILKLPASDASQEAASCLGNIPNTTMAVGNTTMPTFVEGELQLTQTLDGPKVTPGRELPTFARAVYVDVELSGMLRMWRLLGHTAAEVVSVL
jgi:hypothetical protein